MPDWRSLVSPKRQVIGLAVLLVAALAIGSGVGRASPETPAERAAGLEADLRCPSCQDVSVAQSTTASALAVRREVTRLVQDGASNQVVDQTLVHQYGTSILLRPAVAGVSLVVWLVPVLVAIGGLALLGMLFWRRSRSLQRLHLESSARTL